MAKYATVQNIKFCDNDVVNPDDYEAGAKLFIFHEASYCIGVVIAEYPSFHLQDALDMMADEDKLDAYKLDTKDNVDYDACTVLGNACESFDIESVEIVEAECPMFSLVALFSESNSEGASMIVYDGEEATLSTKIRI